MKNADHIPDRIELDTPQENTTLEDGELGDADLESVAGGVTWHLPNDPPSTPWDENVDVQDL